VAFEYPISDQAVLIGLEATLDNKTIETGVKSKKEAEEMYKYAMDHGYTAVKN
jgi:hypothetical protein